VSRFREVKVSIAPGGNYDVERTLRLPASRQVEPDPFPSLSFGTADFTTLRDTDWPFFKELEVEFEAGNGETRRLLSVDV
jgi:hypothetical protein